MKLAKVTGSVVATRKAPAINNLKILLIQPLDDDKNPVGCQIAAIDTVHAGQGDLVYWILSREASLALPDPFAPVDATITGIVDQINQEDVGIKDKDKIFSCDID